MPILQHELVEARFAAVFVYSLVISLNSRITTRSNEISKLLELFNFNSVPNPDFDYVGR